MIVESIVMTDIHVHEFTPRTVLVPLRKYVKEDGKTVKDTITGRDTLKQFVCKCGKVETVDLIRKKA